MKKIGVVLVFLTAVFMCVSNARADITPEQRDTAIVRGLRWLAHQQKSDGHFEDPDIGLYRPVALTALAVLKFEEHAKDKRFYDPPLDPFDTVNYEYADEIILGWNYLSTKLYPQTPLNDQNGHDPEQHTDHDNCGIYFDSGSKTYETGIVMMALQASARPDSTFPGNPTCATTFKEVLEDCVDWYAWAQCDRGAGRGGWRYSAYNNASGTSDNSVTQWPVLGFMSAEAWGITAPDWVLTRSDSGLCDHWVPYSQYIKPGDPLHGGFGYTDSTSHQLNVALTASGMIQLAYCCEETTDYRWDAARGRIGRIWYTTDPWGHILDRDLYSMYGVMKAAMTAKPAPIEFFGDHDWQKEYDSVLIFVQDSVYAATDSGYWPASSGYNKTLNHRVGSPYLAKDRSTCASRGPQGDHSEQGL